jgi:hypothetical protein
MMIINQVVQGGGGSAPAHYIEKTVDANGKLQTAPNIINMNGATDVGNGVLSHVYYGVSFPPNTAVSFPFTMLSGYYACANMFYNCRGLTSANLPALTTISGDNACDSMFLSCLGLASANLSALTTINGNSGCYCMFQNCIVLTSANLPALTTVSGVQACAYMFSGCSRLTSANLSALTTISGDSSCGFMFSECSGLTSVDLSALTTISGNYACEYMFQNCTSLATVYIGDTTAITFGEDPSFVFSTMFEGCSQDIDVYAPAANQSQIEAFESYPNFGGTGTVTWHWRS